MGTVRKILLSHQIMIAKVVLSLTTIASLATAAPQLFSTPALPSPRGIDQNQVVTSVISTLQPAIAAAVAEALRGSSLGSSSRRPTGGFGYQETRERQEGAVTIKPQPDSATRPGNAAAGLDINALIAQVITALEPAIQNSVSNILGRNSRG